jgi:hypothetical protein
VVVLAGQRSGKGGGAKEPLAAPEPAHWRDCFFHPIGFRFSFGIPKTRPYNNFFRPPPLRSLDMREPGRRAVAWRPTPNRWTASIRRGRGSGEREKLWVSEAVRPLRTAFKHLPAGAELLNHFC